MARVTVLGSGTCVPSARRGPAGYVYEGAGQRVLVDSGSGTLGRMAEAGIDHGELTAAAYTHTHPDHTADLAPLLFAMNYTPGLERTALLRVIGPAGFGEFLAGLSELYPGIRPKSYAIDLTEVADSTVTLGALVVRSFVVEHAGYAAVAYRFEGDDSVVVFSGDTTECPGIVAAAEGADLLVIEASSPFDDRDPGPHLTAAGAGRVAAEAGAGTVVLTHQFPVCDDHDMAALAAEQCDADVLVAEDLMVLDLPAAD